GPFCSYRPRVLPAGHGRGADAVLPLHHLRYFRGRPVGRDHDSRRLFLRPLGPEYRFSHPLRHPRRRRPIDPSGRDRYLALPQSPSAGRQTHAHHGQRLVMTNLKIRAIIFDIGPVLIPVDGGRAMKELGAGLSLAPAELWSAIEKDPRWPDWQEGRMTARDWHLHLTRRLGVTLSFDQFTHAWNHVLDPVPIHHNSFFAALANK